ncbi:hypothetical protein PTMSG1_03384 [Pyrenophora teres f. maculata]|nr:hypothetical protein PTMSG1_03384 [Pyrenophora teres f. maculata]
MARLKFSPSSQFTKFFSTLFSFRAPTPPPECNNSALVTSSPFPADISASTTVTSTLCNHNIHLRTSLVSLHSQSRAQREQLQQLRHQHNLTIAYYTTRSQHPSNPSTKSKSDN